jgi:hypothetical protein
MEEKNIYLGFLILGFFIVLQILLFVAAKYYSNNEKLKLIEKRKRILESHNKIRSIFINITVAIIVLFIPDYTNQLNKDNFIYIMTNGTLPSTVLVICIITIIILAIISYYLDVKAKRISCRKLNKILLKDFAICLLTIGFVFAIAFFDTAYLMSSVFAIIAIIILLFL